MRFKPVIFDKDGVIIDTKEIHYNILRTFLNERDLCITEEYNSCVGVTLLERFTRINNKFGKDYDVDTMVKKFQKKYIDKLREYSKYSILSCSPGPHLNF